MRRNAPRTFLAVLTAAMILSFGLAEAVPTFYTDRTDWVNAVLAVNAGAGFHLEDFDGLGVTPGTPGSLGYGLGPGPHSLAGGDASLTLSNIGNGGSQTGIVASGSNGTQALQGRVVQDSSDVELFPGFIVLGEGAESMSFSFSTSLLGFGAMWNLPQLDDGLSLSANGSSSLASTGFLGVVDPMGISSFDLGPGFQSGGFPLLSFQNFEMDDLEYAVRGAAPSAEPGTLLLLALGAGALGAGARFRREKR
jgi:hypothetical protein